MNKLIILLLALPLFASSQLQKIPLKVSDAYQTNHVNQDVTYLIDDDSSTRFMPANNVILHPHRIIFDLSDYDPCTVKRLIYYDANGDQYHTKFYLVKKSDNTEHLFFTFDGSDYLARHTIDIPVDSQFVASELIIETPNGGNEYPNYIQLWGSYTPHSDPVWNRPKQPLKNYLQANCHPWDIDSLQYPHKFQALVNLNLHGLRLYSDIVADKDSFGNFAMNPEIRGFQPERTFKALLNLDPSYFTQICYQGQTPAVKASWDAHGQGSAWYKYWGTDSTNPASFDSAAYDMYVLSLRGGKNATGIDYAIYPQHFWYDSANVMIKGGGFYKALEGGNEWDGWYTAKPEETYMGGAGLAAASSAMYDGDRGSLGLHRGVKNADTSVLFTNAGLAWDQPDLFREMIDWWKTHRGYKNGKVDIPLDYFSVHSYSSAGGQFSGNGGVPAEYGMIPQLKKLVYFSNKYGNGLPIVIGEWGWDVNSGSILNAPAFGSYTAQQTRGNWAIRAICSFSEIGVDASQWFRLYQDYYNGDPLGGNYANDNNSTQFATMALLREDDFIPDSITRTTVGDYFKQFAEFGDYVYDTTLRSDSVHVVRFRGNSSYLYGLWTVESYTLDASNRPQFTERTATYNLAVSGTKRQLVDGADFMSSQAFVGGAVTLGSKPVFVQQLLSTLPASKFRYPKNNKIVIKQTY